MKKGKFFLPLFLAAVMSLTTIPLQIYAEEDADTEETESVTEHPAAYYDEIQSNTIEGWPQGEPVDADAAIMMDADTGAILYAKNIEKREYPASITKIMTVLLALENGNLSDVVTFSENAVYSIEFGSSHLGLTEGEQLTLEQCLYGIMLASANEISNAVAEHIGGSIEHYVEMMNEKAAELGCTNTHFVNVHGLHDENHYVCAKDMAIIMREALKNEKFREIISTVEYSYPKTNKVDEERYFMNHHKMLYEEGIEYDGCIGGKTGYTDEAGNTLVTAAKRNGQTLITVTLKSPGLYNAYDDTKVLMDYGFASFSDANIDNKMSEDVEITGIEDEQELAKIRQADILEAPFTMVGSTKVTLPSGLSTADLSAKMDFDAGSLTYFYKDQALGSCSFQYTGEWEPLTEAETAEDAAASASETAAETAALTENQDQDTIMAVIKKIPSKAAGGAVYLYEQMDTFIKEHTVAASIAGAVLLLIFVPLLLVALSRHRKYLQLMAQREEEMEARQRLEEEIEQKSAAQVEAELRAREAEERLEEEKRRSSVQDSETEENDYLDEEDEGADKEEHAAEDEYTDEDEYIEVPVDDEEPLDDGEPLDDEEPLDDDESLDDGEPLDDGDPLDDGELPGGPDNEKNNEENIF
ncbi:MAG: D-alanyl-D-alanine carboxypeptidase family protein [Eubacteriales bacterium]|nr:D-alanyl-D-alanine carboxypeptidase family protein [Eubacteriales bacterium]